MPMARKAERYGLAHTYQRHQSEHTRLYQIVVQYYPTFVAHLAQQGKGRGWPVSQAVSEKGQNHADFNGIRRVCGTNIR